MFQLQLNTLIHLTENHVLGISVAHIHVMEFQKRGLPHCNVLLILNNISKLQELEDIDNIISAELPDAEQQPELFQTIKNTVIHGPCGGLHINSPCMSENECRKDLQTRTDFSNNENNI